METPFTIMQHSLSLPFVTSFGLLKSFYKEFFAVLNSVHPQEAGVWRG
jgi:hypothetical protein